MSEQRFRAETFSSNEGIMKSTRTPVGGDFPRIPVTILHLPIYLAHSIHHVDSIGRTKTAVDNILVFFFPLIDDV